MKYIQKFFIKIHLAIIHLFIIISCNQKDEAPGPPFKAQVLQLNYLTASQPRSEAPTYKFDVAQYSSLLNLNQLDGNYFQMIFGGELIAKNIAGSIIVAKEFSGGESPHLRYKVKNGFVIPKDYPTFAMLSSYYQFDLIAENIQAMTGISMDTLNSSFGKIKVLFEPKISYSDDDTTQESSGKTNAAYLPIAHQFVVFQRSGIENVPLAANLQVVAHEFGHAIWEFTFDGGLTKECDRVSNEYSIRGLNEGFADMMSYTLTGSTNILKNSLDFGNTANQRNFSVLNFNYDQISNGVADTSNNLCSGSFYCIGTLFANSLFNAQKNLNYDQINLSGTTARGEYMTKIVNAMKTAKRNMINLPSPLSSDFCNTISDAKSSTYNGKILGSFFQSFLAQITDLQLQSEMCTQLKNNFGNIGFSLFYRDSNCQ